MNDIKELMEILIGLGGRASTAQIMSDYCKKYHIIAGGAHKAVIEETLCLHGELVTRDVNTGDWIAVTTEKAIETDRREHVSYPEGDKLSATDKKYLEAMNMAIDCFEGKKGMHVDHLSITRFKNHKYHDFTIKSNGQEILGVVVRKNDYTIITQNGNLPGVKEKFDPSAKDGYCHLVVDKLDEVIATISLMTEVQLEIL